MGRRRIPIDPDRVIKLGRLGCTNDEIADILGCSHDTLTRRFASELARARAARKMSIRRAQTIRAIRDRSDKMLIHLGVVELGQGSGLSGDINDVINGLIAEPQGPGDPGEVP